MKKLILAVAAVAAGVGTNAATFYASPNPVDPSTDGYCETESTPGTIRDALARCTSGSVLQLADGVYKYGADTPADGETYYHASTLSGTQVLTIRSATGAAGGVVIEGAGEAGGRSFLRTTCRVTISGCTFTNFTSTANGGALNLDTGNGEPGYIFNCRFFDCHSSSEGGAVQMARYGSISNCLFYGCSAAKAGAVKHGSHTVAYRNCAFSNNWATTEGGCTLHVDSSGGGSSYKDCVFFGNWAQKGGCISGNQQWGTYATYSDCLFTSNAATAGGGAAIRAKCNLLRCTFVGNVQTNGTGTSVGTEGGVVLIAGAMTIDDCKFYGNICKQQAPLSRQNAAQTVTNCLFVGNTGLYGGGVCSYTAAGNTFTLWNCKFFGNTAYRGGAGYMGNYYGCVFGGNRATDQSGAVESARDPSSGNWKTTNFILENCIVTNNVAPKYGVGMIHSTARNCLFAYNQSTTDNSSIIQEQEWVDTSTGLHLENCTIASNRCAGASSAVIGGSSYGWGIVAVNTLFAWNSVAYDLSGSATHYRAGAGTHILTNCIYATASTAMTISECGTCHKTDRPRLYYGDAAHPDFSPKTLSPARDGGADIGWTADDLDLAGKCRVVNDIVDIGCYEWQTGNGLMLILR
ncbi:MAG: hypothetical protein MJ249_11790 [Kiritimatiellae bacterium]|nr:hypothetical protein [Kiritimatiellia bacterium]